jgi:mitochondrial import inner membrane translocase subunit TIM22
MNQDSHVSPANKILGIKITEDQKLQQLKIRHYSKLFSESCITKSVFSGVAGFGLGAFWGLFTAALDYGQPSIEQPFNKATPTTPGGFKIREVLKFTGQKTYFMAKSFGFVGLIYSGVECTIEKGRGKHDLYSSFPFI